MKFSVLVTRKCDARCTYCYIERRDEELCRDTARACVDWVVDQLSAGEMLDFGFFGGEPLLRFDLIEELTCELRERSVKQGFPLLLSMTTNARLLDESKLKFMAAHRVGAYISLDGPYEVHTLQRGTSKRDYDRIVDHVTQASEALHFLGLNAVYGPETIFALPATIEYLSGFGLPVHLNWDITSKWDQASLEQAPRIFHESARWLLEQFRSGRKVELHPFEDKALQIVFAKQMAGKTCRMGEAEMAADVNGDLYPCERLVGREETRIGHVHTGCDQALREAVVADHRRQDPACEDCSLKTICRHDCGCSNWFMTASYGKTHSTICLLEKALIGAMYQVWGQLSEIPDFREYMYRASQRRCILCQGEVA